MQGPRGPGEVFLKAGTCFLECKPALMLPTQLPAQGIQLVGLWLGGKGMTGASGQEPGEPFLGGDWDERAPCAENSALPFSTPQGAEAEVRGSDYTGKHRSNPREGSA